MTSEAPKVNASSKEAILAAAKRTAMAHGYGGLNFRDLADEVGIRAPSIYHHFPSKADLGTAVARRYWQDIAADLEAITAGSPDAAGALRRYPEIFRASLANGNRMCLCSFMSAEYDDLPAAVKTEVQAFADVNMAWLGRTLAAAGLVEGGLVEGGPVEGGPVETRARAIFAAVAGAQLLARSRSDIALFDATIATYRAAGLLPD